MNFMPYSLYLQSANFLLNSETLWLSLSTNYSLVQCFFFFQFSEVSDLAIIKENLAKFFFCAILAIKNLQNHLVGLLCEELD